MEKEDINKCWVTIVYDWGDEGLPLARTSDPKILCFVKRRVLSEAQKRLSISKEIDKVVSTLDEAELKRLQTVLDILIPPEMENVVLSKEVKGTDDGS